MRLKQSSLAKELLALEKLQMSKELSEAEQERFAELADSLFQEESVEKRQRKSFRIDTNLDCTIKVEQERYNCKITSISLRGFFIESNEFRHPDGKFDFVLDLVQLNNKEIQLGLKCIAASMRKDRICFGAQISSHNSPGILSRYLDLVYYPFYFALLEKMASES